MKIATIKAHQRKVLQKTFNKELQRWEKWQHHWDHWPASQWNSLKCVMLGWSNTYNMCNTLHIILSYIWSYVSTYIIPLMCLCIGGGNGNPLQCSCLENPRDGGAWWAVVYGVAQSWTRLKRLSSSSMCLLKRNQHGFRHPQLNFWSRETQLQNDNNG